MATQVLVQMHIHAWLFEKTRKNLVQGMFPRNAVYVQNDF